jgi:hypothetical protein
MVDFEATYTVSKVLEATGIQRTLLNAWRRHSHLDTFEEQLKRGDFADNGKPKGKRGGPWKRFTFAKILRIAVMQQLVGLGISVARASWAADEVEFAAEHLDPSTEPFLVVDGGFQAGNIKLIVKSPKFAMLIGGTLVPLPEDRSPLKLDSQGPSIFVLPLQRIISNLIAKLEVSDD